jgi:phosphatidylserine decarboxylase
MLDSLGSTLSSETVNSFFTRNGKKPVEYKLTVDEAIQCLEMQVGRSPNEKKRVVVPVEEGGLLLDLSTPGTPGGMGMIRSLLTQAPPQLGKLDFLGPPMRLLQDLEVLPDDGALKVPPPAQSAYLTEFSQQPLTEAAADVGGGVQKHSRCHTPPVNPQVHPLMLKTAPAPALVQTQAQAPKIPLSA